MQLEQALGSVLREIRKERGLSQEALALDAGVERNYISLIELGRNSASVRIIFKVCTVLGVAPSSVFVRAEELMQSSGRKRPAKR